MPWPFLLSTLCEGLCKCWGKWHSGSPVDDRLAQPAECSPSFLLLSHMRQEEVTKASVVMTNT